MATIDLDNLQATDITPTLNALHRFFMAHGITVVTDNLFLKPEHLAQRAPRADGWEACVERRYRARTSPPRRARRRPGRWSVSA